VGLDQLGRMALRELEERGVDVSHVRTCPDAPTGMALILWAGDVRGLVSCRGANDRLSPLDLDEDYLSSARLVLGASLRLEVAEALARACHRGQILILDPGGTLARHGLEELRAFLEDVDVFTPNEVELTRITGLEDLKEAIRALWSAGPKLVIVKAGPRGCFLYDGEDLIHLKALRPPELVDPTGAGDAFNAGLALGLLRGLKPVEAARLGIALATLKLGRKGASNMPGIGELRSFLARLGWLDLLKALGSRTVSP